MGGVYTCCIHEVCIREGGYGIWWVSFSFSSSSSSSTITTSDPLQKKKKKKKRTSIQLSSDSSPPSNPHIHIMLLLLLLFLHSFRNMPFFKKFLLFAMTTTEAAAGAGVEEEAEATSVVQVNNFCRKSFWVTVMNGTFGVEGNGTWELPSAWWVFNFEFYSSCFLFLGAVVGRQREGGGRGRGSGRKRESWELRAVSRKDQLTSTPPGPTKPPFMEKEVSYLFPNST